MYYLEHWLPTVTQVLVIGWRGRKNRFWEMWNRLRQTPKDNPVVVVTKMSEQPAMLPTISSHGAWRPTHAALRSVAFPATWPNRDSLD